MTFSKTQEELKINYNKHELYLHDTWTHKQSAVFHQTESTITRLSNTLDNYCRYIGSSPNHQLKIELGKLSYYYLKNSYSAFLSVVSYKVEFLHLVLDSIDKASILAKDPDDLPYKPYMVCGIDISLLHKETSCCNKFLSFFYVSAEEQLCNDVLDAVKRFNKALDFHEIGCELSSRSSCD
jgi:hypothetical protein